MHSDRTCARLRWCAAVCLIAVTAVVGTAQEPWEDTNWGAQASVKFLYNPAWQIEFERNEVRFLSRELTYVFLPSSSRWSIQLVSDERESFGGWVQRQGRSEYVWPMRTSQGLLEAIQQESKDGQGTLLLRWAGTSEVLARPVLWTREQLGRAWFEQAKKTHGRPPATTEALASELHVAEPRIADWDEDSQSIWLAIRFYAGEGSAGLGTVVEINKSSHEVRLHQPDELALVSISRLVVVGDGLWLATERFGEGGQGPGIGLVRYNVQTGAVDRVPEISSYITAMARTEEVIWIATVEGFHAFDLGSHAWQNWRTVPRLELAQSVPVMNLPGAGLRGQIPPARYEVRWVGEGFVEVLTPSCANGLIEASWFKHLVQRDFFQSSEYVAASRKWGNPPSLSLFNSPVPNHFQARPSAWFLRVPAVATGEKLGDWEVVRACAGWVELPADRVHLSIERQD